MRRRYLLFCLAGIVMWAPAASAAKATVGAAPKAAKTETKYFAVFMDGRKVGYSKHTRRLADGKVTTTEEMVITIRRLNTAITVRQSETHIETTAGEPLGFKSVQDLGIMAMTTEGTVDKDGKITATVTSMGNIQKRTLDWPEGAMMSEAMRQLEKKKGFKEGTTYSVKAFSASSLAAMSADIRVGATKNVDLLGRVVPLTEVTTVVKAVTGAMTITGYVDRNSGLQKSVMPALGMNIELVICNRRFALSKNDVADFLGKFILPSPKPLGNVAAVRSITYTLAPTGKTKLRIPATDNQSVRTGADGVVLVTVRPLRPGAGAAFPYKGSNKTALSALKSTPFLQCDDKLIKALARKAVGDSKDAAEAVRRIEAFARRHIEKKTLSVGYASASEVARSRQGDCTEHAVLAAAMCRAVGIPAQVVVGLAYVENLGGRKSVFGPHAWTRTMVGGKWIGLDAALNGYDAGHIALAAGNGSPEDFFSIISTLGYFKIAKVTVGK